MYIVVGGLNHRTAPLEIREKAALSGSGLEKAYRELLALPGIEGAVILSTCNRTEIYATTREIQVASDELMKYLAKLLEIAESELGGYLYNPTCFAAIEHLFRVSSGLDSMVLGETQIIGQVKEAWLRACELGATDLVLNTLFQRALFTGRRVRQETGLDRHAVSISYAAVEMAQKQLGSLSGKKVVVIGAGEMGQLAAYYLSEAGATGVIVSNRSIDRAREVADKIGGQAVVLAELPKHGAEADIVISSTSATHYILRTDLAQELMQRREQREIVIIDIAVPRDVEPEVGLIKGIHLFDIDDLQQVVDSNLNERQLAAKRAENIIIAELADFEKWLSSLYLTPVIAALRQKADAIVENEVERTVRRLGAVDERLVRLINNLAVSISNQLLRDPINMLKEVADSENGHLYSEVLVKMFGLELKNREKYYAEDIYREQG